MTTELLIFGTWRRGQLYFQKICLDTNPSLNNYESLISLNLLTSIILLSNIAESGTNANECFVIAFVEVVRVER